MPPRRPARIPGEDGRFAVAVASAASDAQQACRRLFDAARLELRMQEASGDRMTLTAAALDRLGGAGSGARAALDRIVSLLKSRPEPTEDLTSIAGRAAALADDLKVVLAADDPAFVHYLEARGRGVSLRAAPIEVSRIIRTAIIGDRAATVLTSATLAVEGGFDYVKARLGLADAEAIQVPIGVRLRTAGHAVSARGDARSAVAGLQSRGGVDDWRSAGPDAGTRLRAVHVVCGDA